MIDILSMAAPKPAPYARPTRKDGRPTKRAVELAKARVAGYHQDRGDLVRILVDRVTASEEALRDSYRLGWAQKQAGVRCGCGPCAIVAGEGR